MYKKTLFITIAIISLIAHAGESNPKRHIQVFDWLFYVRDTNKVKRGPGPNIFSNSSKNVWVDSKGQLHLKITRDGDDISCAEVETMGPTGYGAYEFKVHVTPKNFDPCAVAAGFLYLDDSNEIDVEISKWCKENNMTSQFVVQPWDREGNMNRFSTRNIEEPIEFRIDWNPDRIDFYSKQRNKVDHWAYQGSDNPNPGELRWHFNLWMYKGEIPKGPLPEMIISQFRYNPLPQSANDEK